MISKLKKVLLIEDEPGQRRLLKKMFLEGGDYEVIEAMDGEHSFEGQTAA